MPGDDEEGVVDPDADADHRGEDRGVGGHVDDGGGQAQQEHADAEAEQGDGDGQAHGQHRAEGHEEDEHGGQEADELGGLGLGLLDVLGQFAADRDLDVPIREGRTRLEQGVEVLEAQLGQCHVVLDEGQKGGVVGAGLGHRVADRTDVGQPLDLGDDGFDGPGVRGVGHPAVGGVEDDLGGTSGGVGEALLEQVDRGLGLDAGHREVVGVLAPGPTGHHAEDEDGAEPEQQDPPPVRDTPATEAVEGEGHPASVAVAVKCHHVTSVMAGEAGAGRRPGAE